MSNKRTYSIDVDALVAEDEKLVRLGGFILGHMYCVVVGDPGERRIALHTSDLQRALDTGPDKDHRLPLVWIRNPRRRTHKITPSEQSLCALKASVRT